MRSAQQRELDALDRVHRSFTNHLSPPGESVRALAAYKRAILRAAKEKQKVCRWTLDASEYGDSWDTACGNKSCFIDGGPADNKQRFCGYCGGVLKEVKSRARREKGK